MKLNLISAFALTFISSTAVMASTATPGGNVTLYGSFAITVVDYATNTTLTNRSCTVTSHGTINPANVAFQINDATFTQDSNCTGGNQFNTVAAGTLPWVGAAMSSGNIVSLSGVTIYVNKDGGFGPRSPYICQGYIGNLYFNGSNLSTYGFASKLWSPSTAPNKYHCDVSLTWDVSPVQTIQ